MQHRSNIQRRTDIAAKPTAALHPDLFALPWQALALTVVLTLGATLHTFPRTFAPILRYAHGMTLAAIEWNHTPVPSYYAQPVR